MLNKKCYIVFSPHPDDCAFALGGTILLKGQEHNISNCDVFSDKDYNILGLDEEAKAIIKKEEETVMTALGICNIELGFTDARKRSNVRLRELFGSERSDRQVQESNVYNDVKQSMKALIDKTKPFGIYVPLGCGWHIDHLIVRNCALEIVKQQNNDMEVYFYEDMPYSGNDKWRKQILDKLCTQYILTEEIIDIENVHEKKCEILGMYKSQIKGRDIRLMDQYMYGIREGCVCERIWKMK